MGRRYTVYEDGPTDPMHGDLALRDAVAMGFVGRTVGDTVATAAGKVLTVSEIQSAFHFVVQDAMEHYEARFPAEPFFLRAVPLGDEGTVRHLGGIIAAVEARQERVRQLASTHREVCLPLGFLATSLGASVADILEGAIADNSAFTPVAVEWADFDGWSRSLSVATSATTLVLTRGSLHTARRLDILSQLASSFRILTPQSLDEEMVHELAEAESQVDGGRSSLGAGPDGLRLIELPAGSQAATNRRDAIAAELTWLRAHATLTRRPLARIRKQASVEEQTRLAIGRSSFDAGVLAQEGFGALYADDLGLRKHFNVEPSTSSAAIVSALGSRGHLTPDSWRPRRPSS